MSSDNLELETSATSEAILTPMEQPKSAVKKSEKSRKTDKSEEKTSKSSQSEKTSGNSTNSTKTKSTRTRSTKSKKEDKSPATVNPTKMAKKFTENTVKNFCNSFFGFEYDHAVTFVVPTKSKGRKTEPKNKPKQYIIRLNDCSEIRTMRKVLEKYDGTDLKSLSKSIYTPYIHTVLDYAENNKMNTENFQTLVSHWFGIPNVPKISITNTLRAISKYLHDEKTATHKAFNAVFGAYYNEKYHDDKDVHKRFIQRAPEQIMSILEAKDKKFDSTLKDLISPVVKIEFKPLSSEAKKLNTLLGSASIEKVILKPSEDRFTEKIGDKVVIKSLAKIKSFDEFKAVKGETKEEKEAFNENIKALYDVYSEIQIIKTFINYISEIEDEEFYHEKFAKVKEVVADYATTAAAIDKLVAASNKTTKEEDEWRLLTKALVLVTRLHTIYVGKNPKNPKNPLMITLGILGKNGIKINIKNDKFKDGIQKFAAGTASDSEINAFADEHFALYSQLQIPKAYNPMYVDIYSKLGYFIYKNWTPSKNVLKISKNIRAAVGIAMVLYIKQQLDVLMNGKKNLKVTLMF